MNPWPFIVGAYSVALLCTLGLAGWSFAAMRREESRADALKAEK